MAENTKNRIIVALGLKFDDKTVEQVRSKISAMGNQLARAGDRAKRIGEGMQRVGSTLTRTISAPILLAGGYIAKVSGDFEAAMNVLQAKSGAATDELAAMRDMAKKLGQETQFTAANAAEGMIEFAKAGFNAKQVLDAIGPALNFAVVGQMELGEVTALVANTLAQFNLQATDATHIADVLSKAADISTTDVRELGEALTYAGATANAAGMDIRETSAVLAALANVGMKSSMAGTALANAIMKIAAPTDAGRKAMKKLGLSYGDFVDKSGKLKRPFGDFLAALGEAGASTEDLVDILDQRAARAFVGLVADSSKLTASMAGLSDVEGNAAKQAEVMMKGFNGALKTLKSAAEGLAIAIGDTGLMKFLTESLNGISKILRQISALNPRLLRTITIVTGGVALVGPLIAGVGLLVKGFGLLAASAATGWLSVAAGPILAIAAIGALYLIIDDFVGWIQGRPSVIGYLFPASEWPRLQEFRQWAKDVGAFLFTSNEGSLFDLWRKDLEFIVYYLNKVIELIARFPGVSMPGGAQFGGITASDTLKAPTSWKDFFVPASIRNAQPVPAGTGGAGVVRQTVSPTINVSITKPGSTADDIMTVIRRESAKVFGDLALQVQPPWAQ